VFPGCDVTCGAGEVAMCLPGSCFFDSGPICTCQSQSVYSPISGETW
jgi:hypothetical protein